MTRNAAIALAHSNWWDQATDEQIVRFQLFEDRLCMPFPRFHEAVEKVLKRSVWTHEFADQKRLQAEYLGDKPAPTFQEIMDQIPEEKRILITIE